ncbi:beta-propeller domain-containing protein [Paenibacillus turpanensis]|uniref:beta-propeller domain-containing protein n=1 Tax=Paenibacillus turpanensis TaxID=2689078 RepID=UPI0014082B4B|nr:beta-propeller domain-containing protein [Paenibacillus turpanensis]
MKRWGAVAVLALGYFVFCWAIIAHATNRPFLPDIPLPFTGQPAAVQAATGELPVVGSERNLKSLLKPFTQRAHKFEEGAAEAAPAAGSNTAAVSDTHVDATSSAKTASASDYSGTNVQVQGVDEADLVKTDGTYIYQVNRQRVMIVQANPADSMKVAGKVDFSMSGFTPNELFLDGQTLVVIGTEANRAAGVRALVYDITDKQAPKQTKQVFLEGQYVSARKTGTAVYLVANKRIDPKRPEPAHYSDSASKDNATVSWEDTRYFPEAIEPNLIVVGAFRTDRPSEPAAVSAYVGSGKSIYASEKHLYVAADPRRHADETHLYKFDLLNGMVGYEGTATVPGAILNQFSMDEHMGYFRIATTRQNVRSGSKLVSTNNLYILNDKLESVGKIEDIAPGERIYSVRFMGKRAYMVTFRTVDPLFVIDVEKPEAPTILGYLKIPGYSDYLHPYDENHIIGFGKDTVEIGPYGQPAKAPEQATTALYQGMKLALFDVSDVSKPIEKFKENIGDRGTESELLRNHKALLFSRDKELLAFPVTLMEAPIQPDGSKNAAEYGTFTYQGAYIYRLNVEQGFQLRGRISHLSDQDLKKAGNHWHYNDRSVQRILYIGDTLYTLSQSQIQAHDLETLQEHGRLVLP